MNTEAPDPLVETPTASLQAIEPGLAGNKNEVPEPINGEGIAGLLPDSISHIFQNNHVWGAIMGYTVEGFQKTKKFYLHHTDRFSTNEGEEPGTVQAFVDRIDFRDPSNRTKILIGTFTVAGLLAATKTTKIIKKHGKN